MGTLGQEINSNVKQGNNFKPRYLKRKQFIILRNKNQITKIKICKRPFEFSKDSDLPLNLCLSKQVGENEWLTKNTF